MTIVSNRQFFSFLLFCCLLRVEEGEGRPLAKTNHRYARTTRCHPITMVFFAAPAQSHGVRNSAHSHRIHSHHHVALLLQQTNTMRRAV
ncbi:hypothetical protein QBC38DRAFT_481179, partial [Podospora fimiseda]